MTQITKEYANTNNGGKERDEMRAWLNEPTTNHALRKLVSGR